ncbi:MAG: hypothetical protein DMD94_22305 [Candidatus Rokuibacteriota bacterium]|nr:MAG: hypothetical protein DMD94_22305 [Candidatus Rokubacteria bacterium]
MGAGGWAFGGGGAFGAGVAGVGGAGAAPCPRWACSSAFGISTKSGSPRLTVYTVDGGLTPVSAASRRRCTTTDTTIPAGGRRLSHRQVSRRIVTIIALEPPALSPYRSRSIA